MGRGSGKGGSRGPANPKKRRCFPLAPNAAAPLDRPSALLLFFLISISAACDPVRRCPLPRWIAVLISNRAHLEQDDRGLEFALRAGAVPLCIALLSAETAAVRREAASTLSSLCFAETAKADAIDGGAMKPLCTLLSDPVWQVCFALRQPPSRRPRR